MELERLIEPAGPSLETQRHVVMQLVDSETPLVASYSEVVASLGEERKDEVHEAILELSDSRRLLEFISTDDSSDPIQITISNEKIEEFFQAIATQGQ